MRSDPIVDIRETVRGKSPRVPYEKIAARILPKHYQLSLVLCGDTLSRRINREQRKKDYAPNVLSFPLEKFEGEIFINVRKAARESKGLGITPRDRVAHLFVHGCLHLLGVGHGNKMDKREIQILRAFRFKTISPNK